MSADNAVFYRQIDDKWYVWHGSMTMEQEGSHTNQYVKKTAHRMQGTRLDCMAAVAAISQDIGHTEYGVQESPPAIFRRLESCAHYLRTQLPDSDFNDYDYHYVAEIVGLLEKMQQVLPVVYSAARDESWTTDGHWLAKRFLGHWAKEVRDELDT